MAILWPPSLPQRPLRESWQRTGQTSLWTFQPDAGPTYTRQAGRKGDKLSMTFAMTREQVVTFLNFYSNSLSDGTLVFQYLDPDSDEQVYVRFLPDNDPYTIKARGIEREVSMVWEIMPK